MRVEKVFINTYRYDFHFAKICIASVRYWYPDIPIFLIKDEGRGQFNTTHVERDWNVQILNIPRKNFGWGYAKLETLFLDPGFSFLVLDADTVLVGPVLNRAENIDADFIVDLETQPAARFNEIYYNLDRVAEIDKDFRYPGYSFNSGQWFGTTGKLTRKNFELSLNWSEPPECKFPSIVFKGDQAHLNFAVHRLEQQKKIGVAKVPLMIWPRQGGADHLNLSAIKKKLDLYPFIVHWAGMGNDFSKLPRKDIIDFYQEYFYSRVSIVSKIMDRIKIGYLRLEQKIKYKLFGR